MRKLSYHDKKALRHLTDVGIQDGYLYRQLSQRLSKEDMERLDDMLRHTFIAGYSAGEADERSEHLSIMEEFGMCVTTKV